MSSAKFYYVRLSSGLFPSIFSLIENEISEQVSWQPKNHAKVCKHARRRNLRYYNVSRDENPQRVK